MNENINILEECQLENGTYELLCFNAMVELHNNWYLVTSEDGEHAVLERNYIISLVFQLGRMYHDNSYFGTNVFPSGENIKSIAKDIGRIAPTYRILYNKLLRSPFIAIPDLVIHTSHNQRAGGGQYVAFEAKTTKGLGKRAFMKDLFKLNVYLTNLCYIKSVYIIVNTTRTRIEKLINEYFNSKYFYLKDELINLLFFIQEDKTKKPHVYKLSKEYIGLLK